MPNIRVRDNEPFDVALRRFKRTCEKAGVITEMRRREFFEKPTWKRKRAKAAACKRLIKKISREAIAPLRGSKSASKRGRGRGAARSSSR